MKNLIKSLTLVGILTVVGAAPTRAALIANGSFEGLAPGTTINAPQGGGNVVNDTTITGWRFVDVNSANTYLNATITNYASAGTNALKLTCYYNGTGGQVYMDQWDPSMHTPVVYGHTYIVSIDLAWISGATANNFQMNVQEFDNTGTFDSGGPSLGTLSVSAAGYTTYSFFYTPQKTNTAQIGFVLMTSPNAGATTNSVSIDNVQLVDTATLPTPPNGSFEYCPVSAANTSGGGGNVSDTSTFLGWRFFNAVPSDYTTFNAMIVTNASAGKQAIQMTAVHATTGNGGNSGLDLNNNRIAVNPAKTYLLSFDAAWVAGATANNLGVIMAQFNSGGTFLGQPNWYYAISSTNYHTFTATFTPVANTAVVSPNFQPLLTTVGSTTFNLDNVQLVDLSTISAPWNGSFEYNTVGDIINAPQGGGNVVNDTTIADWRFLAMNAANASFTATIITNASAGKKALRLDLSTTAGGSSYLDQWDTPMQTPVVYGHTYMVSLDAAWISGATPNALGIAAQEFNGSTYLTTSGVGTFSVSSTNYTKSGFLWTPHNSSANALSLTLSPGAGAMSVDNVQIVDVTNLPALVNGSFEYSPMGATSSFTTSNPGGDASTFVGWRLFSVGSPPIVGFTGKIVDAGGYTGGTPGSHAMLLAVTNTGSPSGYDFALDMDNNRVSVISNKQYTVSFDLAMVSLSGGTENVTAAAAEFDVSGTYIRDIPGLNVTPPTDQTFHHYTYSYLASANAAKVNIYFRPHNTGYNATMVLDNVVLAPTPAFSSLTASPTVTYGATSVTLAGTVSASSPTVYPTNGETITVTINGNAQTTTVNDATGDFSITYNPATIPYSASPYPITYAYAGSSMVGPVTNTSTTLTVNKKALTVTGAAATSRPYDGTANATITGTLSGIVNGDTVTLNGTGTFANRNAGTGKAVTSTSTLSGAQAGNYSLTQPTGLTANITARALTITAAANSKPYDGGTTAATAATLTGTIQSGDSAPTWTESYSLKAVGTSLTLNPDHLVVSDGNSGNNYSYTYTSQNNGTITPKALTMSGLSVPSSKVYDGTTTATVSGSPGTLTGSESPGNGNPNDGLWYTGDDVSLTGTATGTYDSKDVASATTVTFGGLSLNGAQAGDYSLTIQSPAAATITPATTTNLFTATPNPSLPGSDVTFTATVTNTVPGGPAPAGDVQFKTNGVPLCDPVALDTNGVAAFTTNSLPHGANTVTAEYAGDSNFLGSTNGVVQIVNTPPIAPNTNAGVVENQTLVVGGDKLLLLSEDPDGDPLSITSAGPTSTNGGTVTLVGGDISYTPALNFIGTDLFSFVVSDPYGASGTGTVLVTVTSANVPPPNVVIPPAYDSASGTFSVTFAGIPNYTYTVQSAPSPTGPWSFLKTATAGTNGLFEVTDAELPPPPARYYRMVYP